jgi:hypothetical protein
VIKIELIRDFYQTASLFFASIASEAMKNAKAIWGNISGLISFDFGFVIDSQDLKVAMIVILGIVGVLLLFCGCAAVMAAKALDPDELADGHESQNWKELKEQNKKTVGFIRYFMLIGMSAYLPISRSAFQILACDPTLVTSLKHISVTIPCAVDVNLNASNPALSATVSCSCSSHERWVLFQAAAIIIVLVVTIAFPILIYTLIRSNIPVGSPEDPDMTYDEDGNMVEYTDEKYQFDLKYDERQLNCPYISLYKGFERKWCYYKVVVMMFKFVVCLPVIFLTSKPVMQTLVTLALMIAFTLLLVYS